MHAYLSVILALSLVAIAPACDSDSAGNDSLPRGGAEAPADSGESPGDASSNPGEPKVDACLLPPDSYRMVLCVSRVPALELAWDKPVDTQATVTSVAQEPIGPEGYCPGLDLSWHDPEGTMAHRIELDGGGATWTLWVGGTGLESAPLAPGDTLALELRGWQGEFGGQTVELALTDESGMLRLGIADGDLAPDELELPDITLTRGAPYCLQNPTGCPSERFPLTVEVGGGSSELKLGEAAEIGGFAVSLAASSRWWTSENSYEACDPDRGDSLSLVVFGPSP